MATGGTHPDSLQRSDRDGRGGTVAGRGGDGAPRWAGATVVCLGSGPSLTAEDVDACRGRARIIAVNDAYRLCPDADVLYACDPSWWLHADDLSQVTSEKWAMAHHQWTEAYRARFTDVQFIGQGSVGGLSDDPTRISHGRNSGHQAVSLGILFGAHRVVLLGYDMQATRSRQHFFQDHRHRTMSPYPSFIAHFETLARAATARGIEIINCSRQTALRCVPRGTLADVLASVAA